MSRYDTQSISMGKDFGVIFNDDGNRSCTSDEPEESKRGVEFVIDLVAGTSIKTLAYCVGTDTLWYPTKVGNTRGWRKTIYEDKDKSWRVRNRKARNCAKAGFDAVRVAGHRAKELGMFFFPSYRMNDDHFALDPLNHPSTGQFWLEHQEYTIEKSGRSPIESDNAVFYSNLLDFSHEAVRQYRLDLIFEIIDRYQDIMDGIELDFTRVWVFFPFGQAEKKAYLITEMVEKIRRRLDELGRINMRTYYLMARVPTRLKSCHWAGLEIERWLEKRLVNILVPAQLMVTTFEIPLDEFVKPAHEADCKVYAGLYPRVGWEWPFVENPTAETYRINATRDISTELIRAAAANYWYLGADGMYLFNMNYSDDAADLSYARTRDVAHPACLNGAKKLFAITKAYYLDCEDNYTYKKQIPLTLETNKSYKLRMLVGEDFDPEKSRAKLRYCGMRMGLGAMVSDLEIEIKVNDQMVFSGLAGDNIIKVSGHEGGTSNMPPAAKMFLQFPIEDKAILNQGWNKIEIKMGKINTDREVILTDVNLGVIYHNNINDMRSE